MRTAAIRPDMDAVVSVSSFASVDKMIGNFLAMMGAPRVLLRGMPPFIQLGFRTVYGVWPTVASPLHDIPRIPPRPILLIHGTADDQVTVEHAHLLAGAASGKVDLWIVPNGGHCIFQDVRLTTPQDKVYRERILGFLAHALP